MHEARLGADDLGEMGEKGDHVVLDLALDRIDARNVEGGVLALVPDFLGGGLRNDPELGERVGRMRLDLEPDAVARLRVPDRSHFGPSVAWNHGQPWQQVKRRALADSGGKLNSHSSLASEKGKLLRSHAFAKSARLFGARLDQNNIRRRPCSGLR